MMQKNFSMLEEIQEVQAVEVKQSQIMNLENKVSCRK